MTEALNGVKRQIRDAEVSFVNLQEAEIKSCIGCETCSFLLYCAADARGGRGEEQMGALRAEAAS